MAIKSKAAIRKPEIDLSGPEGNAFCILGTAQRLAKDLNRFGVSIDAAAVIEEMTSGDYEHLIQTFDKYFGDHVDLVR